MFKKKFFSIVNHGWRNENLCFRRALRVCQEDVLTVYNAVLTTASELQNTVRNSESKILLLYIVIGVLFPLSILGLTLGLYIIHYTPDIYQTIIKCIPGVQRLIDLNAFTHAESILQSTKNADKRVMKYDVFLSYSSEDLPWVQSTLLNFIENKGFKVCFGERDFPYGCSLFESIGRAVYESHKVIAVVSPNYLASRWCAEYEFVLTYTRILNEEAPSNSLLLIKYRDCQMTETMRCLKYLDYTRTMTDSDKRSVWMKVLSYVSK